MRWRMGKRTTGGGCHIAVPQVTEMVVLKQWLRQETQRAQQHRGHHHLRSCQSVEGVIDSQPRNQAPVGERQPHQTNQLVGRGAMRLACNEPTRQGRQNADNSPAQGCCTGGPGHRPTRPGLKPVAVAHTHNLVVFHGIATAEDLAEVKRDRLVSGNGVGQAETSGLPLFPHVLK